MIYTFPPSLDKIAEVEEDTVLKLLSLRQQYLRRYNGNTEDLA